MSGLFLHLAPLFIALVAGSIAVVLHSYWAKGAGWYASASHVVQAAIGVVLTLALTYFGTRIPALQPAVVACVATSGNVLSQNCLDALGGLLSKENIALLLGALVTLFGHGGVATQKVHENMIALKNGVSLPHPR